MATAQGTSAVSSKARVTVKVAHVGAQTAWPKNEVIPTSMDEALAGGWTVTNDDIQEVDGERSATGVYTMQKTVGTRRLTLRIPYRAEFTHGKPFQTQARKLSYETLELAVPA